jgi:hypothetical protein
LTVTACSTGSGSPQQSGTTTAAGPALPFDVNAVTEKTTTVTTETGDRQVTYRFDSSITYVAKPVTADR